MSTETITHLAVYPPLGCARLGSSDEHFLAPEVPGGGPPLGFDYKDDQGRVKRQAVRFRVYGFDGDNAVREFTADDPDVASLEWTVHVANKKASWYEYNNAMDLIRIYGNDRPAGERIAPVAAKRRNGNIIGDERIKLNIDPGKAAISGAGAGPTTLTGRIEMGANEAADVDLGALLTDEAGRLVFVPGNGRSESLTRFNPIQNFSNNDEWFDDMCDGWVGATVTLTDGTRLEPASPGWVFTGPPDYAPEITPLITMYDLIEDVAIDAGWLPPVETPSFTRDIFPLLHRLGQLQWVSSSAALLSGWGSEYDLLDPAVIATMADNSAASEPARCAIFENLRSPAYDAPEDPPIPFGATEADEVTADVLPQRPLMMGDGIDFPGSPMQWFAIPQLRYDALAKWAAGDFITDWDQAVAPGPGSLADISDPNEQVEALTRAALDPVYGGAFHPGVEITWPMRHREMYALHGTSDARRSDLFRLAVDFSDTIYTDFGPVLTPEIAFDEANRPQIIGPQTPGDLTRWMGLPWQCDAASCQAVYLPEDFPIPVWWPANLPVHVLPEMHYGAMALATLSDTQRIAFFNSRVDWVRGVGAVGYHAEGGYTNALTHMINDWDKMGFIVSRPTPDANLDVPGTLFVEIGRAELES